jgi:hypothetical protein
MKNQANVTLVMVCVIVTAPYIKYICQVHIVFSIKKFIYFLVSQMHIPHTSMWNIEQNSNAIPHARDHFNGP